MRIEYRLWQNVERPLAGKIILRPETPEEHEALQVFKQHVGSPQRGRKLDIVFRRRAIGPEMIRQTLAKKYEADQEVRGDDAGTDRPPVATEASD